MQTNKVVIRFRI